jgi:hypothetical protein
LKWLTNSKAELKLIEFIMQFLLNLRIPFVNEDLMSVTSQSLVMETFFWTLVMLAYMNFSAVWLRRRARTLPYWKLAKQRGGIFCGNGQDDSIVLLLFGVHHLVAGSLMLVGMVQQGDAGSTWWRHGYLLETGFELCDMLSLLARLYPYRMEGIKPEMKPAVLFHHLCGTLLAYPILTTGLYTNEHLQAIAMWVLLGASFSCFAALYLYTVDPDRNIIKATAVNVATCLYFLFCRFGMFPYHSFHLLSDIKSGRFSSGSTGGMDAGILLRWLNAGFVFLFLFNLAIAADVIPKTARYVRRAIDGVTPLETAPVPRSRDSIYSKRPSVLLAHAMRAVKRSSLTAKSIVDATGVWGVDAALLGESNLKKE